MWLSKVAVAGLEELDYQGCSGRYRSHALAMTLPRKVELRVHQEIVERWLSSPGIPTDVRDILLDWLEEVKKQIDTAAATNQILRKAELSEKGPCQ